MSRLVELRQLRGRLEELESRRATLRQLKEEALQETVPVRRATRLRAVEQDGDDGSLGLPAVERTIANLSERLRATEALLPGAAATDKAKARVKEFTDAAGEAGARAEAARGEVVATLRVLVAAVRAYGEAARESWAAAGAARNVANEFYLPAPAITPVTTPVHLQRAALNVATLLGSVLGQGRPAGPGPQVQAAIDETLGREVTR